MTERPVKIKTLFNEKQEGRKNFSCRFADGWFEVTGYRLQAAGCNI